MPSSLPDPPQHYGATLEEQRLTSPYQLAEDEYDSAAATAPAGPITPPFPTSNTSAGRRYEDHTENNNSENNDDSEDDYEMSLTELLYSSASYHAIVQPVTLTMTLAAASVMFFNNDDTIQQGEAEMARAYQYFGDNDDTTTANSSSTWQQQLEWSVANSFLLVCGICAMTFVIVFLYKYKCMTCLLAYMMLASGVLLGFLGGTLWQTGIEIYRWPVDNVTFILAIYNFGVVGVYSIFFNKGVPMYITQMYLIATSVILSWQLAHFDSWTAWTLLIMLALYDLCAVLTPCGPLQFLVHLMSKEEAPDMPGLLYEAHLPPEAQRPGVPTTRTSSRILNDGTSNNGAAPNNNGAAPNNNDTAAADAVLEERSVIPDDVPMATSSMEQDGQGGLPHGASSVSGLAGDQPTMELPLALARVYNLPILEFTSQSTLVTNTNDLLTATHLTPKQLKQMVRVKLPVNGGRIELQRKGVYLERDRFGTPRRTVWMDRQGKVFAEAVGENHDEENDDGEGGDKRGNTIRLGLGDFIFYSVLVAKAAQYSFATFAACMLVILAGLGGTLVLLSVYHNALPALPISIFLGVFFYLVTRGFIEPWVEAVLQKPFYV